MHSCPHIPSPIGRDAHQLARALWKVPGVNSDLFLVFVAVYLCHQPQPTSFSTDHFHLRSSTSSMETTDRKMQRIHDIDF